tara:strand:+ start:441 stop:689 length:249 start_codon:yes stop_codon:yes gene_type:complete
MNRSTILILSFVALYLACGMTPATLLIAANYLSEPTRCWLAGLSDGQDLALYTAQAIWCAASLGVAIKVTGINRVAVPTSAT